MQAYVHVWYCPQDRKIEELQQSLMRCRNVQDVEMMVQERKGKRFKIFSKIQQVTRQ